VNSDWFWCKHTKLKPVNQKIELADIENSIISRIDDLIAQEDNIKEDNLIKNIKNLNLEAWNKSYQIIN